MKNNQRNNKGEAYFIYSQERFDIIGHFNIYRAGMLIPRNYLIFIVKIGQMDIKWVQNSSKTCQGCH